MMANLEKGALPLAAKPLTPGYFSQYESLTRSFILAQISPPEAQASQKRTHLTQRTLRP